MSNIKNTILKLEEVEAYRFNNVLIEQGKNVLLFQMKMIRVQAEPNLEKDKIEQIVMLLDIADNKIRAIEEDVMKEANRILSSPTEENEGE